MSRDEKEYGPDSEAFRPERFLDSNVRNPELHVFGFGRRYVLMLGW
jgi:cytochrome P450